MPRTTLLLSLVLIAVSARAAGQSESDQHLIDRLKSTPVDQIEAGLPQNGFDQWFAMLIRPHQIPLEYHVGDCVAHEGQPVRCVIANTKVQHPGWNHWIQIRFGVRVAKSKEANDLTASDSVVFSLLQASEGPSNPRMKRKITFFSKLSDLERYLHRSRMQSSPSKISP